MSSWGESEKISQGSSAIYKALTGPANSPHFPGLLPPTCQHILVTTAGFAIIQVAHKTSGRQEAIKWRHTP